MNLKDMDSKSLIRNAISIILVKDDDILENIFEIELFSRLDKGQRAIETIKKAMMDKLIYEYMGWRNTKKDTYCDVCHAIICTKISHPFDSNSAWEVVQEMERKGDWDKFQVTLWQTYNGMTKNGFVKYCMNPKNFFNCFAKWLEEKVGSK